MKTKIRVIKYNARRSLQGHYGIMILGMLAVFGLDMLGGSMASSLFGGTSTMSVVLGEAFALIVSLITGIFSAGYCYMQLNIARGREYSLGDLIFFFKNQPDRVIIAGFVLALIQVAAQIPYSYAVYTLSLIHI